MSELNQNISAVLAKAQTEDITITKHGKAVAVLINPETYRCYLEKAQGKPSYKTAYDFFKTLPKVETFELPEREDFKVRDVAF